MAAGSIARDAIRFAPRAREADRQPARCNRSGLQLAVTQCSRVG